MTYCPSFGRRWLALLALAACTIVAASCQPVTHTLHICAVDAETAVAIPGVSVSLSSQTYTANADGCVDIVVPEGAFAAQVAAPGYISETIGGTIGENTLTYSLGVELRQSTVAGRVLDARTQSGIEGAVVALGDTQATISAGGAFVLPAPIVGDVQISGSGYQTLTLPAETLRELLDESGRQTGQLDVRLEPRSVNGLVSDAVDGSPIEGVRVSCNGTYTTTDAQGRFTLAYLDAGDSIEFSSPDYYIPAPLAFTGKAEVAVEMEPYRSLVTVTNASTNEPLSGVSVRGSGEPSTTDASGQAWVRQRPGSAIVVLHEGHTPVTLDYTGEDSIAAALTPSRMVLAIQDLETGRPITTALVQLLEDASAATVPGDATTLPVASRLERPDDEGRLVINDALSFARLGIKAPGYRYTSVPITQAGEISISLEPFEMRGVYVPFGLLTVPDRLYSVLDLVSSSELNAIVVDVKSDRAWLAWPSQHPYVLETEAYISGVMDLHEFIDECHSRGIYVVARMVIFKDTLLAEEHDELAVKTSEGGLYTDLEDLHWVDPYRQEVRDYNVQLALEAVSFGFDEVQFDYLRFPSDGSVRGLVYSQESDFDTRTQAMNEFVAQAAQAIAPTSAYFSADIFGLTVWVDPARDMGIGQRLDDIAPYVDYLSPMLYPTTFGEGNLGFERPGLHPYEVVYHSVLKARSRTSTLVRPWLQHYSLGIDYGVKELLEQKKGADDGGSAGWIFWNAGARYMDEIFAENAYSLLDPVPTLEPEPTALEDE